MTLLVEQDSGYRRTSHVPDPEESATTSAPKLVESTWESPDELPEDAPTDGFPEQLINRYVDRAMRHAIFEMLPKGRWYAEVTALPGVWAEGDSEKEVDSELAEVIRGWVMMKIQDHDRDMPVIDGINLNIL